MQKTCLDCEEPIKGRTDKKFCSDECRNNYNNKLNSDSNNYVRNINNILRKNRRILADLNPTEKTKVAKKKMVEKGFDFNHITNITTTRTGSIYNFCYEHGYLPLENDFYLLVVRKDRE